MKISVRKAILMAVLKINLPSVLIMIGGMMVVFLLSHALEIPDIIAAPMMMVPILMAWLWWSVFVPRWRVWALERVDDPAELIIQATPRIMWPPGHFFEKTEIKTASIRAREKEIGWDKLVAANQNDS